MIGIKGEVIDWNGETGHVLVRGESWQAMAGRGFQPGDSVKVIERRGLTLIVVPT
ncbi:MAG: NfeD family protein [Alphaproteobacteria bacterium]